MEHDEAQQEEPQRSTISMIATIVRSRAYVVNPLNASSRSSLEQVSPLHEETVLHASTYQNGESEHVESDFPGSTSSHQITEKVEEKQQIWQHHKEIERKATTMTTATETEMSTYVEPRIQIQPEPSRLAQSTSEPTFSGPTTSHHTIRSPKKYDKTLLQGESKAEQEEIQYNFEKITTSTPKTTETTVPTLRDNVPEQSAEIFKRLEMSQVTSPATPVSEDEYTLGLSDCDIGLDYVFMKSSEQTISEPKNVKNISYFTSSETTSSSQSCQQKRQGSDIATAMTTKPTPLHVIIPNVIITNENESESEIPTLEIKEIAEKSPLIDINPDMQRAEFRQNYPRSDRLLCQLCDDQSTEDLLSLCSIHNGTFHRTCLMNQIDRVLEYATCQNCFQENKNYDLLTTRLSNILKRRYTLNARNSMMMIDRGRSVMRGAQRTDCIESGATCDRPSEEAEPTSMCKKLGTIRGNQQSSINRVARETKTAGTLAVVVGGFVACWLPFFILYLATPFVPVQPPDVLMPALTWLGWINSAINPFIYAFYSADFRLAFWRLTCRKCSKSRLNLDGTNRKLPTSVNWKKDTSRT